MKKIAAILLIAVLTLGMLAGCHLKTLGSTSSHSGQDPDGPALSEQTANAEEPLAEPVSPAVTTPNPDEALVADPLAGTYEITVWASESYAELTSEQISRFNETNENGITFSANVVPVPEYDVVQQMTDGTLAADLYFFYSDFLSLFVQNDALSPLDAEAERRVKADNAACTVTAASENNRLYAYPVTDDNGFFLYYDKTVIPEEDVDSLEKLIEDCEAANRFFSFETVTSGWYLMSWFFATGCVSDWQIDSMNNFISLTDTVNSPEGMIAVKGMKKLLDSKCFMDSSQGDEFLHGAAVVVSGVWDFDSIHNLLGENMGVADLPSFEADGKYYHLGSFSSGLLLGVKPQADSVRSEALHKLAQYLTDEACQLDRYDSTLRGPSNRNAQAEVARKHPGYAALFLQNRFAVPQRAIHVAWWGIANTLSSDIMAAKNDRDLQKALDTYYENICALFSESQEASAWSVIGDICGTMWDTDFPMFETEPGVFRSEALKLHAGEEFKVRQNQSWDVNYGLSAGKAALNGENLVVPAGGTYCVVFDSNLMTLKLERAD